MVEREMGKASSEKVVNDRNCVEVRKLPNEQILMKMYDIPGVLLEKCI